jgi:hypothetical protein
MSLQGERLVRVETKVDNLTEKLDDFIATAPKMYASKLSEKIVYTLCGVILMAVVGVFIIRPLGNSQQNVTITTQNPDGTTTTRVVPLKGNQIISGPDSTPTTPRSSTGPTSSVSNTPTSSGASGICIVPVVGLLC